MQGRECVDGVPRGARRCADDSRRGPHGDAGRVVDVRQGVDERTRRLCEWEPACLSDAGRRDEVFKHDWEQIFWAGVFVFAGPANQGHAVRDESSLEKRLAAHGAESG